MLVIVVLSTDALSVKSIVKWLILNLHKNKKNHHHYRFCLFMAARTEKSDCMQFLLVPAAMNGWSQGWIRPLNPSQSLYWPRDSKSLVDKSIKVTPHIGRSLFLTINFGFWSVFKLCHFLAAVHSLWLWANHIKAKEMLNFKRETFESGEGVM